MRGVVFITILATAAAGVFLTWAGDRFSRTPVVVSSSSEEAQPTSQETGVSLYSPAPLPRPRPSAPSSSLVIPDCRLTIIDKQEVPSQRDGVLLFVGTEVEASESVPAERLVVVSIGGQ